ncbi:nitrogen assimilation transcription factor nirA [Fusarium heterosporum]|uniref:Nitrogen assimilation transcription factor nirA n=1 Tax=Fusarium heterosporum TaxID=42747 RepID=A0A8H5T944_FUSHE|nr:nitrogen assimilation transcription factor nirA [Fusarium heterosporum]
MLELRKGSKDLLQALEILRTAPDDDVATVLQDLRSRGSVVEFLQSVASGSTATRLLLNPAATSRAEVLADSKVELDLNMRYPGAFPPLETLEITDVDLSLLAVQRRPEPIVQQTTFPLSPYSQTDPSSRISGTPESSESFSTPIDAIGDVDHPVDPRLEVLKILQWTSVPIPDLLAAQVIYFYLVNEHPVLAFFDADLLIRDIVTGGRRFCSPLLVSALLAWSCASFSQFEPRALPLSIAFLQEAKTRWKDLQDRNDITTLSAAMLLVLTSNQRGQDRLGLEYLDASAEIGRRLGLFGDKESSMPDFNVGSDEESRPAASFAAWGAFGWHRFESTHQTMFITPGLIALINEVFRKPHASDAQFWFILAARGCLSVAAWCKGGCGIIEGLMAVGRQNGTFKREGWISNVMVEDILSTTQSLVQDGTYDSVYPINFDSVSENIQDIGMQALAKEFKRLDAQSEAQGQEAEVLSEQKVWKGDLRDLDLTLTEATEGEEYF